MHIETGRVISSNEYEALRNESPEVADDYAPLPRRLSRAAQRLLDRGERYPTTADPELLAHHAKLRKKRQRLAKAGRKTARKGK